MKTLDEVIQTFENCDIRGGYFDWKYGISDILHYLKEYKKYNDTMCALPDYYEWVHSADNPPLTWDELRKMEGKPVWIEKCQDDEIKGWLLILRTNADVVICTTKYGNNFHLYKSLYDEKWKAYKKERFNTEYEDISMEYFENGGI